MDATLELVNALTVRMDIMERRVWRNARKIAMIQGVAGMVGYARVVCQVGTESSVNALVTVAQVGVTLKVSAIFVNPVGMGIDV